jgi:Alanine racemase, N-terminal domain
MTFTLHVDAERWHRNAERVRDVVRLALAADDPTDVSGDLVPVAKGNGYGLGNARLARETTRLGLTRIAVGTVFEVEPVAAAYDGDILVLTPYEPADILAAAHWDTVAHGPYADRVVRTISSTRAWRAVLASGTGSRVVLEALTSVGRFGLTSDELFDVVSSSATTDAVAAGAVRIEGLALHEPMTQPHVEHVTVPGARWHDAAVAPAPPVGATGRVQECLGWGLEWQRALADLSERVAATGSDEGVTSITAAVSLWVSHLDDLELASLRSALPDIAIYARIGTRLWLGDRGAVRAFGTVLAVHGVVKGQASGYRQRRAGRAGAVVVVGGGTSHGVALEAPSPVTSTRQRAVAAGTGVLEGAGRALSPFVIAGRQRWFAEPPHMHVSLVRVPDGVLLPAVGDEVDVEVRLTTVHPDRVIGLE